MCVIRSVYFILKNEYLKNNNNNVYFLKCDIHKYFTSIDHDILIKLLEEIEFSDDEMWLIKKLIKEQPDNTTIGLPLGNQSSQWLALLYLNKIDHYIKEQLKIKHYVRYMDDMISIHKDKNYLSLCKRKIEEYCSKNLNLQLNDKTQIGMAKNGVDFLGYRHILNSNGKIITKLRQSSKQRMEKHLKTLNKMHKKGLVDDKYVYQRKNAFYNHIVRTNENNKFKLEVYPFNR